MEDSKYQCGNPQLLQPLHPSPPRSFFFFSHCGVKLTDSFSDVRREWLEEEMALFLSQWLACFPFLSNMLNLNWCKWHHTNREPFRRYTHNSHQHIQTQVRTNTHAQRHVHPWLFNEIQLVFLKRILFRLLFSSLYL